MRYSVYAVESESTTILVSECEAQELTCSCAASWLFRLSTVTLSECPYCGQNIDRYDVINYTVITAEQAGASSYAKDIRGIARSLWRGDIDFDQAYLLMVDTIRLGLTSAWYAGAKECGIAATDLSPDERNTLMMAIANEQSYVIGFLDAIVKNSRANDGALAPILARAELWGLRYADIMGRARLMACADQALEWVRGPTSDGCTTCVRMNGKVKRSSYWATHGPHPRHPPNDTIKCGGWKCLCELLPTTKPLSRGPLPSWP